MNTKTKKILLTVGFVLSVIAIAVGLYFAFFQPEPEEEPAPGEELPIGALPGAPEGGPEPVEPETPGVTPTPELEIADEIAQGGRTKTTELTASGVQHTTTGQDGQGMNYYDPADGRFYTIDGEGNVQRLSNQQFPEAESVEWNKDGNKAVIEFPDNSNVVYNFNTEQQITLPKHWEDFEFSPNRDEILAKSMAVDPNNRWMVLSNADGSNVKPFQALGENGDKVTPSWSPNDQVVAFSDTGNPLDGDIARQQILPLGKNQENFKGLTVEGIDFRPLWSPNGRQLVYSVASNYSNNQPMLWVSDGTPANMGENRRSLGVNTWADKCTFASSDTLYCAVPRNLPANSGIQPALATGTPDDVYEVNLSSGKSQLIATPEEDVTMENLNVADNGGRLFYNDAETGQLETIRLK